MQCTTKKVLDVLVSVPYTMSRYELGVSRGATDHETQPAQDQDIVTRAELAIGIDPPSWTTITSSSNADPGIVTGELPTINTQWMRLVAN